MKRTILSSNSVKFLFPLYFAIALTLISCTPEAEQAGGGPGAMPPAAVEVMSMQASDVPFVIELPATLSGSKEVEIRARVSGILESRNFVEGDRIKKGQSLFTLEAIPFELEVEQAKAALQSAKARLEQAKRDRKRLEKLRADKSVSQRDYDNSLSELEIAEANITEAKVRMREMELNLQYSKVTSPVEGIVGREYVSEGTYIPGPSLLLTEMTQLDPMRLRFGLSEREQLAMRRDVDGKKLILPEGGEWLTRIKLQDNSLYQHLGKVNFSDVRVNSNTGTSEYQAIVKNPDFALRPGQFVRVLLEGAVRKNAYVVPQRAVLDSGTGKFVYLLASNGQGGSIAQQAPVEVGEWVRDVEIGDTQIDNGWVIRSGLKNGDKVIVDGMARIFFPGAPVQEAGNRPANSAPPAANSSAANQ